MKRYKATLVNGMLYVYGATHFRKGEPREVDEDLKKILEEQAVDEVTMTQGKSKKPHVIQKFEFEPIQEVKKA